MRENHEGRQIQRDAGQESPFLAGIAPLLAELSEDLASARPIELVLERVLYRTLDQLALDHGFVATVDPEGNSMAVRASCGFFAEHRQPHFAPRVGVIGRVWASGEPILVEDYESWSGRGIDMQAAGARGLALTPVKAGDEVVGILAIATVDMTRTLDRSHLDVLAAVAHLVAIALRAHPGAVSAPARRMDRDLPAPAAPRRAMGPLFDLVPAVLWVKDCENRVLHANVTAARTLNLPVEEVEGQYLWELDPENAASSYRHDLEAIEAKMPLLDRLEEKLDAAGERRWWRVDRAPVLDPSGDVQSLVVLARDVSDHHISQARLEASRRAAERANRIKSHTLATLAHDVRVPLERVHALADRLLAAQPDPDPTDDLVDLRFAADSALAHVQDLLDFARVEASNLPVESAPLDLRELVEDVLELSWQGAHSRGIALVGHVDPSIPPVLHGDLLRVRQVLVQLLAQALRAVQGGEVVVSARTVLRSEHHWEVRLEIHASAWSLLPQELERMFGPFLHGEDVLDESPREGGIGLALAHRLVQLLGGRVGLDTAGEGELSCWCAVPFDRPPVGESTTPPRIQPRAGARALIVDPHPSTSRILVRQLQDLRLVADAALDGATATAMVEQARQDGWAYDLCLVGERLPDSDALAWIESLGDATERHERVVLLVPFGRRSRREGSGTYAPDARLTQPVRSRHLAEILAALVGQDEQDDLEPELERLLADERMSRDLRVFVLEADPLQQRLVETALRRLGCEVESHSDPTTALDRLHEAEPGEFAFALVDPRLRLGGRRSLIESIRRVDVGKGHRALYALIDSDDLALREESLAAGVDGVAGRPPRYEDLRRLLARHDQAPGHVAVRVP